MWPGAKTVGEILGRKKKKIKKKIKQLFVSCETSEHSTESVSEQCENTADPSICFKTKH